MDKYMKKSDVIAYIRNEAKEAQSAFEELGGESGIIAEAFNDLANDFAQGAVPFTTAEEAFAQIPATRAPQWISVKDRLLEKESAALGVIGVPLCFLSGWTNENAACGVLAAALLLLADSAYRGKRTPISAWLCLAAQAVGAAMMILAPGNFARASAYAYDSMAWEIVKRLLRITLYTGVYAGAGLLAMPIVHGMGRALHVPMRNRRAALLLLTALLSAYAPHGVDAAVGRSSPTSGTIKLNLEFQNTFDFPITIDCTVQNGALCIAIRKGEN